jgi:hypothetical protein
MATGRPFDLPFMVEQWDDTDSHIEELIALTGDYGVARAAFEEAVKRRRGRRRVCLLTVGEKISTSVPARTNLHQEEVTQR